MNVKERALELKKIKNRIDELQAAHDEYYELLENQRKKLQELAGVVGNHTSDGRAPDRLLEMIMSLVDEPIEPATTLTSDKLQDQRGVTGFSGRNPNVPMVMVTKDPPNGDFAKWMELVIDDEDFDDFKCLIAEELSKGTFRIVFVYTNEDGELCRHTMESERLPEVVNWWTVPVWLTNLLVSAL